MSALLLPIALFASTPATFPTYWSRFAPAVARGDMATVREGTRFPFLYEGRRVGPDGFQRVWSGLFGPKERACLAKAKPVREDRRWAVFCGPYIYYFGIGPGGWRLEEFAADPEAGF
jgi:hypothetical protein